jgi:hypothetical protein
MGIISTVQESVDAVMYLTEAPHVTREVLHLDGGVPIGTWSPAKVCGGCFPRKATGRNALGAAARRLDSLPA